MNSSRFLARMLDLMPRLGQAILRMESNDLGRGRLSLPQFWAMEQMFRGGALSMCELATALRIKCPTATMLMNGLVEKGLARRERATEDRRIVRVRLTPRGRRVYARIHEDKRRNLKRVFHSFSPHERALYIALLEKVVGTLGAMKGSPP